MAGGQLGTGRNTGFIDAGTSALLGHLPPGSTVGPTPVELDQYAIAAARNLLSAVGGTDTHSAIGYFLGDTSFTAGVVVGMGQNLVESAVELVKFLKMLALADYYQSQHLPGFWNKFGRQTTPVGFMQSPVHGAMALVGYFWPEFDHEAQEAYEEREALIETVKYAFTHPGEVFDKLTESQVKRYEEFARFREQHTLAGEFRAGVLFGELVIDLLMVVGAVAGLAKLVAKIPRLAKLLPRLRRLVPTLKAPKKLGPLSLPKVEPPVALEDGFAPKRAGKTPSAGTPDPAIPPTKPPPTGPRRIVAKEPVKLDDFKRLNQTDPAVGRLRPGEAGAAAEMERYLGGTLERAPANSSVDYVFTSGQNAGKTVDFMLTPDSTAQATKINQYFAKNVDQFATQLGDHAAKADFVPMDTRFLSPQNKALLEKAVGGLPENLQSKIILIE